MPVVDLQGSIAPFNVEGAWLRCNFHAHTTESDGMLPPEKLHRFYWLGDFDVLAITDHDRLTPIPEGLPAHSDLLVMPGSEISLRAPVSGGPLHVLALGISAMPALSCDSSLEEAVEAIGRAGGVAIVAHPWWSGLLPEELGALDGVLAIEVFNTGCEVEQGRGNSSQYWDALLAKGVRINAIATDDHHLPGYDTFRAWTMVRAARQSVEAVLDALHQGHYYSSRGPTINDIRFEDGHIVVEASPVASISAVAQPPYGGRVNAGTHGLAERGKSDYALTGRREGSIDGELITRARFPLPDNPGFRYLRIEAIDEHGRHAWSNPIWFDR